MKQLRDPFNDFPSPCSECVSAQAECITCRARREQESKDHRCELYPVVHNDYMQSAVSTLLDALSLPGGTVAIVACNNKGTLCKLSINWGR